MGGPGSGRAPMEFDESILYDFIEKGLTKKDIAEELDVSIPTLNRFISEMQEKSPVLLQYRSIQSLQLTELQAKILAAITPDKIATAGLKDLVLAYKILKEKEQVIEGNPTEIKGLVAYLVELEKRDAALAQEVSSDLLGELALASGQEEVFDVPFTDAPNRGKVEESSVARPDLDTPVTPSGRRIPNLPD